MAKNSVVIDLRRLYLRLFRRRRHPIKRDENGRSARQRAFDLFGKGQRPAQVSKIIPISLRTACRYFEDFKKLHHKLPYSTIRKLMRESPEISDNIIAILANSLEMDPKEVAARMQKPWGLMEAMKGRWPDYGLERERSVIEDRLLAALEVVKFADVFGKEDPKMVRATLKHIMIDRGEESLET